MKAGYLSEFFAGVALKTLSAVEADTARSRQHEFNGVQDLIALRDTAGGTPRCLRIRRRYTPAIGRLPRTSGRTRTRLH